VSGLRSRCTGVPQKPSDCVPRMPAIARCGPIVTWSVRALPSATAKPRRDLSPRKVVRDVQCLRRPHQMPLCLSDGGR
jgi:hypothetical protein